MSVLLEVCIDSIASARNAFEGGADRLELCSSLAAGGTTPSESLVRACVEQCDVPAVMMIRPHDGNFVYREPDIEIMLRDIELARNLGVQGVVFGALTDDGQVDQQTCSRLMAAAGPLETTFHRAFDVAIDAEASFQRIQDLGFTRILTSGQQATAIEGAALLRRLNDMANSTSILAGAGVTPSNVCELVKTAGLSEVHASASRSCSDAQSNSPGTVTFGGSRRVTDTTTVRDIKFRLQQL